MKKKFFMWKFCVDDENFDFWSEKSENFVKNRKIFWKIGKFWIFKNFEKMMKNRVFGVILGPKNPKNGPFSVFQLLIISITS